MAGRAERWEQQADAAQEQQQEAIDRVQEVFADLPGLDPGAIVEVSTLLSPRLQGGRADALVLLSPSGDDLAFILVGGLTGLRPGQLPLQVQLVTEGSRRLLLGEIEALDQAGGGGDFGTFSEDLTEVSTVVVRDARGRVLLRGALSVYEPTA